MGASERKARAPKRTSRSKTVLSLEWRAWITKNLARGATVESLEGALVGSASGLLALVFAQAITWGIATWRLNLRWHPFWVSSLAVVAATTLITVGVGLAVSLPVLRRRPADYLRTHDGR